MAADWYPKVLADRIPWHANYNVQAIATGATYSLSAGDLTDILNDKNNVALVVNFKQAVADYAQAVTEWATAILDSPIGTPFPVLPTAPTPPSFALGSKPSIQARTRQTAGVVKADADYNAAVGEAYGIVAPAGGALADPSVVRATPQAGTSNVDLSLFKGGYDVMAVDMRRAGGAWVQIGIAQTANFTDTTAPLVAGQPEQREYRVQGMLNNARTGGISPTVSTVTVP